ncbi:Putative uncharacterized protein [Staphylococcus aureus subsp. aureus ST228]|uniref:Uncharacterized protein n=2 Tax=Staphylococcus aureus TaxID=1280 RepID=A0A7U7EWJ0_STAAU|nr:putative membrane protein [Staphylococcus aureus]CCJ10004.1 Putative uncharacterized protein [Staphylococcus aureus subsp. aureus ST228]CCJ11968.1 Putative uncharacterized protein [Staphylococcus aureus subsp. aureus ST228]CCJ13933.1 Putative uncharacterized protein [Staphylococcus aureus subsp. aureus ST228]CCJ17862.1 Putative uncharacterized protein [Staphylococcus aureus subsp. aureus ST228]
MRWFNSWANPSEDSIFPCISNVMTVDCGLILASIRWPSFSFTCSISLSLIFSGAFSSGTSMMSILVYGPKRFSYSAMACFQYFSFSFPTAKMVIFMSFGPPNCYQLSSYPQVINLFTLFPLIIPIFFAVFDIFLTFMPNF